MAKSKTKRVYTSKDKQKVLDRALKAGQVKISLWKSPVDEKWHAAHGPENVPNWAIVVDHVK